MTKVASGEKVTFGSSEIEDALRALLTYGGDSLGFVITPTEQLLESPTYEIMNRTVGIFVFTAITKITRRLHTYTHETTSQHFGSFTGSHCDGLNLPDYYLQLNTLEQRQPAMPHSRALLKAYELDDLHAHWLRMAAESSAKHYPITTMRTIRADIHDDATECGASHTMELTQAPDETIVFINGYPGDAAEPGRYYFSHEFRSVTAAGEPLDARRPVTYGRVATF